jgi:hypothetical protein
MRRSALRCGAVWIGLSVLTAMSMAVGLLGPMGHPLSRAVIGAVLVVGLVGAVIRWRMWATPWMLIVPAAALILAVVAATQPSNYDTGLYHIGSITYLREGGTVPGLANLHDRFGFSSSMWPLSVALGLGMWDGGEFRLVNGLLVTIAVGDLIIRLRGPLRTSPGTYVYSLGLLFALGAVIQYPGRLIASSAQDTAAAILVVASGAYLVDFLVHRQRRTLGSVAIVVAALAGAMRPLGWIFAVVTVVSIVLGGGWRRGESGRSAIVPGLAVTFVLGALTLARDIMTSGWLFFPVALLPVPVSWRVPDPGPTSRDILAWARTPFQDPELTLASNEWIPGWLLRLPTDWSIPALGLLLGSALVASIASQDVRRAWQSRRRVLALGLLPPIITVVFWLMSAPDPRFAWGSILLVGLIPVGVLASATLSLRAWWRLLAVMSFCLILLATARASLAGASWNLAEPPSVEVTSETISDGTRVSVPVNGDQCWSKFPLCRPWYAPKSVGLRGTSWVDGFTPLVP